VNGYVGRGGILALYKKTAEKLLKFLRDSPVLRRQSIFSNQRRTNYKLFPIK
jgi:hypothetical protein